MPVEVQTQLTLPVSLDNEATFDNFLVSDANQALVAELKDQQLPDRFEFIWLWGAPGAGCSHLLQAICHSQSEAGFSTVYVPLSEHAELEPEMLSGLETADLVCLDDLQAVAGLPAWESVLFTLYNSMLGHPVRLLVAADCSPANLGISLPDLASRLQTALIFQLHGLDDESKGKALQLRAKTLGFELPDEVVRYLLQRYSRDPASLFAILGQLDTLSLQRKRKITVPLLKELLQGSAQ